jgi:predicted N-acyltransferase
VKGDSPPLAGARTRIIGNIKLVDAGRWNHLAAAATPFLRHEFLSTLEESGCVGPHSGWAPCHVLIESHDGELLAALPLYAKGHSRGEFVFDFSFANAYAQHGLRYYPKLLTAVPFTPVGGSRLLTRTDVPRGAAAAALIQAAREQLAQGNYSSWHVLFPDSADMSELIAAGGIERRDCQFHWQNQAYESFEAFLADFTAEKRKKAKRERRRVAEAGITFETRSGGDMDASLWRIVYEFYADTFWRHGHEPYLNLRFFESIAAKMPESLMLKIAMHSGTPIAVAIFFVGPDALYGRYWGAGGNYHSLHFETCYYQGIDYCIEHGLKRFEPGTQGEHKIPRGFRPSITRSAHFIADPRFERAIRDFAIREASEIDAYARAVNEHIPFNRESAPQLRLHHQ